MRLLDIAEDRLLHSRGRFVTLVVLAILVAVLWPGRQPADNRLRWRSPGPGLRFVGAAQALSDRPIFSRTGELTLEVWLVPGFIAGDGNQEIISFYDDQRVRPLLLGQYPRGFIFRGREDNPSGSASHDSYIDLREVELAGAETARHLAVTVTDEGARLYVNGRATSLTLSKTVALESVAFGGRLMLGSSNTGWGVWMGGMLGVAVYERALDAAHLLAHAAATPASIGDFLSQDPALLALYRFAEGEGKRTSSAVAPGPDLTFPDRLTRPMGSDVLVVHDAPADRRWLMTDVALNILGFMPLGFVISWKKRTHAIVIALATGFALSLGVELIQPLIPGRSSSLIDVASNSLGALAGALLARLGRST